MRVGGGGLIDEGGQDGWIGVGGVGWMRVVRMDG